MKSILINKKFLTALIVIFFASSIFLYGDENGRTGRTLKTSTSGCSCHGGATSGMVVAITGPDTLNTSQTQQYTLTVTHAGSTGMGLDIAVRLGALGIVSNTTHLSGGEITHNANITMVNGTASVTFNYTAPAVVGLDTIFANGMGTNSQSNTGGDFWNWAPGKRVVVRSTVGIEPTITPAEYKISQNYPNPFNPTTNIDISLAKESNVSIKVYDINGAEVYTITNSKLASGDHTFTWNAINNYGYSVNSGVYFMKINAGGNNETRKMILIK
jgi:hypothetical protein